MVKTRSQRAVEARVLNDFHLTFMIDEIKEGVFGQQENQNKKRWVRERKISTDDSIAAEGGKNRRKAVTRSLDCKQPEKAEIEEVLKKSQKLSKLERTNAVDSYSGAEERYEYDWGLPDAIELQFLGSYPCMETLNGRWAASGSESRITAKDFLEYYAVKYVTAADGTYLSSSSSRLCFFDLSSAGRVWNDNLLWVSGEYLQRSDEEPLEINNRISMKESFIDVVAQEGNELEAVLKELEISWFKKEVLEESDKINEGADLRLCFEVEGGLLEEQCRANAREKMVVVMDDEFKKRISHLEGEKNQLEENLTRERGAFQLEREKEREASTLKLKEVRAESEGEEERLVTASAISQNNLAGKLYQLIYTKAEIMAFSERNYGEMEIMDEEEVEGREDGLNDAEKTAADNQEAINQVGWPCNETLVVKRELELCNILLLFDANNILLMKFRIVGDRKLAPQSCGLRGLIEVAKKSSAELQEKAASGSRHEVELAEYRIRALNEEISDIKCNIRALNEHIVGKDRELRNAVQIHDSLIARLNRLKAELRRLIGRETQSRDDLAEIQTKNQSLVDNLAHARRNVKSCATCEGDE
ncbi:hypothetical protein GIB67_003079 [Kingdonia uniflora]|uniref:Uncharacterized protein n=1 Tax=Kingdonia uniflora TaxID=39325 RepID=A0A7J7N604_9MAGN|nr:hypothetical protein GIB67_003079 [Kingdonia uniflora]